MDAGVVVSDRHRNATHLVGCKACFVWDLEEDNQNYLKATCGVKFWSQIFPQALQLESLWCALDFAFALVTRKTTPEQRAKWDLSNLRVAMSGAEPIRDSTVREFIDAFKEAKLRPEAFCPCYGLVRLAPAWPIQSCCNDIVIVNSFFPKI